MRILLEKLDFDARVAHNGDDAEAILKKETVDLILSDIILPGRNGVELLSCYRAYQPDVPIIMMTGCGKINLAIECFKKGASDFLTKPIGMDRLEDVIRKAFKSNGFKRKAMNPACVPRLDGYRFLKVLGEGSMGIVYLVERDEGEGVFRQYALKTFKSMEMVRGDRTSNLQRRFENEAKVAFAIRHPHVIQVYDFGRDAEQVPYLLMEYFDGVPIDQVITRHGLGVDTICYLLAKVADALRTIHECGVCHRDIKPSNVLTNDQLDLRVMDFGIARFQDSTLTTSKNFLGSPPFMSPEMFVTARVDGRSDIFSLGSLAYFTLTGKRPFRGEDVKALAYNLQYEEPKWPSEMGVILPPTLEEGLKKMLTKDPNERLQTAQQAYDLFSEFATVPETVQ